MERTTGTDLWYAAVYDSLHRLRIELDQGAPVDTPGPSGETALQANIRMDFVRFKIHGILPKNEIESTGFVFE